MFGGPERRSRISPEEKQIIAYHEAGHALVMSSLPDCDPVHKVSIVARGMALGYTMPLPEDADLRAAPSSAMSWLDCWAGELQRNSFSTTSLPAPRTISTGAKARSMVTQYGMSHKLGPRRSVTRSVRLPGQGLGEQRNYGEEVARTIDEEVKSLVDEAHERAHQILLSHRAALDAISQRLMEVESLDAGDLNAIIATAGRTASASA